jgi:tetratricopeptide (TPR) repeat protein
VLFAGSLTRPDWLVKFGQRLRAARARAGLTQQALGAPDLGKSFISLLESGRSYPSVETVVALAARTRVSVASLLFEPADLRLETIYNLMQLAWDLDPVSRGPEVLELLAAAETLLPDLPADVRLRATLIRARVAMAANRMSEAARLAQDAADRARRHRLGSAVGVALSIRGIVEERQGMFQRAVQTLQQAIDLMRRARATRTEEGVWALLSLGASRLRLNQLKRAQQAYRRAHYLAERLTLPRSQGRALTGLGLIEWAAGRLDAAVDLLSRAYGVFEGTEDLPEMGRVLTNLGRIRREQGLYAEALAVLQKALRIRERQVDLRGCSAARDEIAAVLLAMGRAADAAAMARRAIRDAAAAGDRARRAVASVTMARISRARGQRKRAAALLRHASAAFARLGMTKEAEAASAEARAMVADRRGGRAAARRSRLAQRV